MTNNKYKPALEQTKTGKFKTISGFDINAFRASRQKKGGAKHVDLLSKLNEIDPRIASLAVGAALPLKLEPSLTFRANIMRVRAPLTNITMKGRDWEGRSFDVVGNEDEGVIYIYRGEDLKEPKTRAPSTRGQKKADNRAPGDTGPDTDADKVISEDEAVVQTH